MSYVQRFGVSRKSPLTMGFIIPENVKEKIESKEKKTNSSSSNKKDSSNPATEIINKNISNLPVSSPPPSLDADRLNDPNYNKDSLFTKAKTMVQNPFDSIVALMGTNPNMTDLRQVRQLHEAKKLGSQDAADILQRSSKFNLVSSLIPPAMAAQGVADLMSGDPTSFILGKAKKAKGLLGNIAKGLYYGGKVAKKV